ncbi:MAG: hypothetical protein HY784_12355 [Chloroflexi bacterium]|nr:hypothetical protein [Chloroflexota bacterium]
MSKKELPTFKTAEEFDEFFETHDLGEYWDEFEDVTDIEFVRPRPAHVVIPVEVSEPLLEVLRCRGWCAAGWPNMRANTSPCPPPDFSGTIPPCSAPRPFARCPCAACRGGVGAGACPPRWTGSARRRPANRQSNRQP